MGVQHSKEVFTGILPSKSGGRVNCEQKTIEKTVPAAKIDTKSSISKIIPPAHALLHDETNAHCDSTRSAPDEAHAVPESVRMSQAGHHFRYVCSEILPDALYVSNLIVAQDFDRLEQMGITHILSCCQGLFAPPAYICINNNVMMSEEDNLERQRLEDGRKRFQVFELGVRDHAREDLGPFLYETTAFIHDCISQGGKVLVHCHKGISRSCTLVIAYLMFSQKIPFKQAFDTVKSKRPICNPNAGFLGQLIEWEHDLQRTQVPWGLYRFTPHAKYDKDTWVLKKCLDPFISGGKRVQVQQTRPGDTLSFWLWDQGIFVYMNSENQVIVWKGPNCHIADGIEMVQEHIQRMLRMQCLYNPNRQAMKQDNGVKIVVKDQPNLSKESPHFIPSTEMDHFGYATELAWALRDNISKLGDAGTSDITNTVSTARSEPEVRDEVDELKVQNEKSPRLFLFEPKLENHKGEWEELTQYDSEDLEPASTYLLLASENPLQYIWIGQHASVDLDTVVTKAHSYIDNVIRTKVPNAKLQVIQQGEESETFWELFEMGY